MSESEKKRSHITAHGETSYSPSSLLRALTANPLDYSQLRNGGEEDPPMRELGTVGKAGVAVLAVALGFMVSASAVALRKPVTGADNPRTYLSKQLEQRRQDVDALVALNQQRQEKVSQLQGQVLGGGTGAELSRNEEITGATDLTGEGIVVQLQDSQGQRTLPGQTATAGTNRVRDTEVQLVVNALWHGGAEAISVNGQRVTARTAIRTAGDSILVDFRPLSPPYEITAIGDPDRLYNSFAKSSAAAELRQLGAQYGIGWNVAKGSKLIVPKAPIGPLRHVRLKEGNQE
ncbi:DUF881 domain-containing protein [Dermabacteraceae bacterium P13138]